MLINARTKETIIALGGVALFAALVLPVNFRPTQDFDRFERIAAALEAYAVDNSGKYPPNKNPGDSASFYLPNILTTPIAYLTGQELRDPLAIATQPGYFRFRYMNLYDTYAQIPTQYTQLKARHGEWLVWSPGYDRTSNNSPAGTSLEGPLLYDATNGTISFGDMVRSQRMLLETGM